LGRATTAARSASRIGREYQDVAQADESVEQVQARLAALTAECEAAVAELERTLDPQGVALREAQLAPRKSDTQVGRVSLVWTPWRMGNDGFLQQAW
jgi:site-specific recombinase